MTKKYIILKQSKEFLELQQSFGEVKQKLIHMYAKDHNIDFIQACINLDEFQLATTRDFLTYISNDSNKNLKEFIDSINLIKHYLDKFYEVNTSIS
jgi:hypothetical protein